MTDLYLDSKKVEALPWIQEMLTAHCWEQRTFQFQGTLFEVTFTVKGMPTDANYTLHRAAGQWSLEVGFHTPDELKELQDIVCSTFPLTAAQGTELLQYPATLPSRRMS